MNHIAPTPDPILTEAEARARLISRQDYIACPTAFVDCRLPGSHLKRNYSMIGPGVTTATSQHVNLREPHGFNIGAAGMPPGITNNLHLHFTAEVFMLFGGTYRFRWGTEGQGGEYVGHDGDILSIPTWIFRGFTNEGPDEAMVFTTLGGDDTGGIIWHPSILAAAAQTGLYLTRDNQLIDTQTGATPPPEHDRLQPISPADIAQLRTWTPEQMRRRVVTPSDRAWSADALLDSRLPGHHSELAPVIGYGITQDRTHTPPIEGPHGFSQEWLRLPPGQAVSRHRIAEKQVLLAHSGPFEITLNPPGHEITLRLEPWSMLSIPAHTWRSIRNTSSTPAELLMITAGEARKTPEWPQETHAAAAVQNRAADASGLLAPAHLLPRG